MNNLLGIISTTLLYSAPLLYAALGGVISEHGGIVNIGIEGMMTIGALVAATVAYYTLNPWLAFVCGGLAGMGLALLHGIATINFAADHVVSGIAINLIGPGLSLFLARLFFEGTANTKPVPLEGKIPKPFFDKFPPGSLPDVLFNQYVSVYLAFVLVFLMWFLLYKTKLGLRIRSVGEHPRAAETLGVNVVAIKYFCVLLSGFLAGLGGASLSIAVVSGFRETLVSGKGFIALAAVIFGGWKPVGTMWACLLFGASQGLGIILGSLGINVDTSIIAMTPFIVTLIALILFVKNEGAPSASGQPYEKQK